MRTEENIKTAMNYMKGQGILEERVPHCMKLTLADFVREVLEYGCFREDCLTNPEVLVQTVRDAARTMSENLFEDYKSDETLEWGKFDKDLFRRIRCWLDSSFPTYKDSIVCGQSDASALHPITGGYVKIKESDRNVKVPEKGYIFASGTQTIMPDDSFQ